MSAIPTGITQDDVRKALSDFEAGVDHEFGPSTFYDLVHNDRRYPPKAILGLAARRIAGKTLRPNEFSGGEASECFSILRNLGFTIVPKDRGSEMADAQPCTWIEITNLEHGHGGAGWEYGTCLWSPVRNSTGNDSYRIMREPRVGDRVLPFLKTQWPDQREDTRIAGASRVAAPCREVTNQPPQAGGWGERGAYHRIDLADYTPFQAPLPVAELVSRRGNDMGAAAPDEA